MIGRQLHVAILYQKHNYNPNVAIVGEHVCFSEISGGGAGGLSARFILMGPVYMKLNDYASRH